MSRRLAVPFLCLAITLSAGCDQSLTTTESAFQPTRSSAVSLVPFKTSSYSFHGTGAAPEPGCNAAGESRRYLAGEGAATHLGSYTVLLSFCSRRGGILSDGRGTFEAANGDLLDFTFHGTSSFAPPFTLSFTSFADFTGGTGRFDGATGQAVVTGTIDVRTGFGDGRWEGEISSVGSSKH